MRHKLYSYFYVRKSLFGQGLAEVSASSFRG